MLHCAPMLAGCAHVPNALPLFSVHVPPQQSVPVVQMSPFCPQNDGCAQMPDSQYEEQQSPFAAHALPSVLHVALSAAQLPPVQVPPQHSALAAQALPSLVQEGG
jgi:hypothetical protein